jgi:hypothetical protein
VESLEAFDQALQRIRLIKGIFESRDNSAAVEAQDLTEDGRMDQSDATAFSFNTAFA